MSATAYGAARDTEDGGRGNEQQRERTTIAGVLTRSKLKTRCRRGNGVLYSNGRVTSHVTVTSHEAIKEKKRKSLCIMSHVSDEKRKRKGKR